MQHMTMNDNAFAAAREATAEPAHSFAIVQGLQYKVGDEDRRTVSVSFHSRSTGWQPPLYAALYLSPDEARGLAARLLDEADVADERLDAPVEYALTGKAY